MDEEALVDSIPDKEVEKDFEEALVDSIPDKEVEKDFEEALIVFQIKKLKKTLRKP